MKIKINKITIVVVPIPNEVINPKQFATIGPTYGIMELAPETNPRINQLGWPIARYISIVVIAWAIAPIKKALTYCTKEESISRK